MAMANKVLTDEWKRLERACEQGSIAVVRECITVSHVSVHSQNQVDCLLLVGRYAIAGAHDASNVRSTG